MPLAHTVCERDILIERSSSIASADSSNNIANEMINWTVSPNYTVFLITAQGLNITVYVIIDKYVFSISGLQSSVAIRTDLFSLGVKWLLIPH